MLLLLCEFMSTSFQFLTSGQLQFTFSVEMGGRETLQQDIFKQLFASPPFNARLPPAAERVLWSCVPFQGSAVAAWLQFSSSRPPGG